MTTSATTSTSTPTPAPAATTTTTTTTTTSTSNHGSSIKKKQFNIIVNPEIYTNAEKHGYYCSVFDGEEIKGNVEIELAKPEMVKCVRLQLIGYISKGSKLTNSEVLKYINNPQYAKSSNHHSNSNTNNSSSSKFDNLTILVDYDIILWGKYSNDSKKKTKENTELGNVNRKDLINQDFTSTRMSCEPLKLPFIFKLFNKTELKNDPLPSSYKEGKCKIVYFLYATINRPWPRKNSKRIMFLRVLQKIKVDIPKYLSPMENYRQKEIKFLKYIKKGLIEMNVSIPKQAYCHRENIPIEVKINHLGMNKTIYGIAVGLYERCFYKDQTKALSFKLLMERFYEFSIKPGETDKKKMLNFPLIDGNCYIEKKFLQSIPPQYSRYSQTSIHSNLSNTSNIINNSSSLNNININNNNNNNNESASSSRRSSIEYGGDGGSGGCSSKSSSCNSSYIKAATATTPTTSTELGLSNANGNNSFYDDASTLMDENEEIKEEEIIRTGKEKDKTKIKLSDAKVGCISVSINHEKWPIKVEHVLRVVAITNEYVANTIKKLQAANREKESKDSKDSKDSKPMPKIPTTATKTKNEKEKEKNNDYEEYCETDSQVQIQITTPEQLQPQEKQQSQSNSKSNSKSSSKNNSKRNSKNNVNSNNNSNSNSKNNINSNATSNATSNANSNATSNANSPKKSLEINSSMFNEPKDNSSSRKSSLDLQEIRLSDNNLNNNENGGESEKMKKLNSNRKSCIPKIESNYNNNNNNKNNNNNSETNSKYINGLIIKNNEDDYFNVVEFNRGVLETNAKYGIITGSLCNSCGQYPSLPKMKKMLDCEFNIVIGSLSNAKREYGTETKIIPEIEDQYLSAFVNNTIIYNKLKLNNYKKEDIIRNQYKVRARASSYGENRLASKIDDLNKSLSLEQARQRSLTSLSANSNKSLNASSATAPYISTNAANDIVNKELPSLPLSHGQANSPYPYPTPQENEIYTGIYPILYAPNPMVDLQPSAPYIEDVRDDATLMDSPPPPYEFTTQYTYDNSMYYTNTTPSAPPLSSVINNNLIPITTTTTTTNNNINLNSNNEKTKLEKEKI